MRIPLISTLIYCLYDPAYENPSHKHARMLVLAVLMRMASHKHAHIPAACMIVLMRIPLISTLIYACVSVLMRISHKHAHTACMIVLMRIPLISTLVCACVSVLMRIPLISTLIYCLYDPAYENPSHKHARMLACVSVAYENGLS